MNRAAFEQIRQRQRYNPSEEDSCEAAAVPAALESVSSWSNADSIRVPFKPPESVPESIDSSSLTAVVSERRHRHRPRSPVQETDEMLKQLRMQNQLIRQMSCTGDHQYCAGQENRDVLRAPAVYHVTGPACCKKEKSSVEGAEDFATLATAIKGLASGNPIYGAHSFDPTFIVLSLGFVFAIIGVGATFLVTRRQRNALPPPPMALLARAAARSQRFSSSSSSSTYSTSSSSSFSY